MSSPPSALWRRWLHSLLSLWLLSSLLCVEWVDAQTTCPPATVSYATIADSPAVAQLIVGTSPFSISTTTTAYGVAVPIQTGGLSGCTPAHFSVGLYSAPTPVSTSSTFTLVATTADVVVYSTQTGADGQVVYVPFLTDPVHLPGSTSVQYVLILGNANSALHVYETSSTGGYEYYYNYANHNDMLPQSFTPTSTTIRLNLQLVTCDFTITAFTPPAAASNCPAATTPTAGPQSGPVTGLAYSDPFFSGFFAQTFYIHGVAGGVYSVLSDAAVQLNTRLVLLHNISCPERESPVHVHCSSHAGTYFGEMAVSLSNGDRLHVVAGEGSVGFASVTVDSLPISVNETYGTPPPAVLLEQQQQAADTTDTSDLLTDAPPQSSPLPLPASGLPPSSPSPPASPSSPSTSPSLFVHRLSARSLLVVCGVYELLIENSDRYLDLVQVTVSSWRQLIQTVQPTGLMGLTWNRTAAIPPTEAEHREQHDDLWGCDIPQQKHCPVSTVSQTTHDSPMTVAAAAETELTQPQTELSPQGQGE